MLPGITVNLTIDEQGTQFLQDGALTITLTAPNGSSTTLYSKPGDDGQNFINTTFSDLATESILEGSAPYSNASGYQPFNPLAALNGSSGERHLPAHDRRRCQEQHGHPG